MNAEHWMNELNKNQILRNVRKLIEKEVMESYRPAVMGLYDRQMEKGLQKYGTTVNPSDYTLAGWLEHLQQELMDGVVYCETLKFKFVSLGLPATSGVIKRLEVMQRDYLLDIIWCECQKASGL
jgi:hypothetical protein